MTAQQERKQHIRAFMQAHYTDERLAQLLAHAQDGKLNFCSCCCFIGIVTADHALESRDRCDMNPSGRKDHLELAHFLPGADAAERAFLDLCGITPIDQYSSRGETRRRILIPMIRAEQKRRERARFEAIADKIIAESLEWQTPRFAVELSALDVAELEAK